MPKLTQTVLRYLEPKPTDKVLDVGCGDGRFTANFISSVDSVLGIDASPSMIETARKAYGDDEQSKTEFRVVDCRYLQEEQEIVNGTWDKVYVYSLLPSPPLSFIQLSFLGMAVSPMPPSTGSSVTNPPASPPFKQSMTP